MHVMAGPATSDPAIVEMSWSFASLSAVAADVACLKRELARQLPTGLHLGAVAVLSALDQHGPERMSDVAERLRVDLSAVSRYVRALEERGLISRRPDADDRRTQVLSVTDDGRARLAAIRADAEAYLRAALAGWTDDEVRTLRSQLDRLHRDLQRVVRGAGST